MLRFEKARQLPNQQLAVQPIIKAHLSSMPCALHLILAVGEVSCLPSGVFPDGSDRVSGWLLRSAQAGRLQTHPGLALTAESGRAHLGRGHCPVSCQILSPPHFFLASVAVVVWEPIWNQYLENKLCLPQLSSQGSA